MPTKKITDLTKIDSVQDSDLFIVETSEGTRSVSGSIVKEYAKCNSNLLDNWYFANPVNRNNKSSYIGMDYNIDRWKGYGTNQVLTINENGISASGDSENGVIQYLHKTPKNSFKDKEMTLSILTSDNALIVYSFKTNNETTWYIQLENGIHMEFGLVETPYVAIVKKDSSVLSLKAVKFEFSSQQTLAHKDTNGNWVLNEIPNYAEQMTICKQYDAYTGNYIGVGKPAYNLLDNSDFRNPIAQAGLNGYHAADLYIIDKWRSYVESHGELTNEGLNITTGAMWQKVPHIDETKIYTFVVKPVGKNPLIYVGNPLIADIYDEYAAMRKIDNDYASVGIYVGNWEWAALYEGEYTPETIPVYIPKGRMVEMINCGIPLQPRNLLDNSDFRNFINQRNNEYTTGIWTPCIDRWRANTLENDLVWHNSDHVAIPVESNILQVLPSNRIQIGKCYTLVCKSWEQGIHYATCIVTSNNEYSINIEVNGLLLTLYSIDDGYWYVKISNVSISEFAHISWVALYEGSYTADTIPPYVPKGYAVERAECRRYYRRYNIDELSALGYTHGGYLYWTIQLDDEMQSNPLLVETSKVSYITSNSDIFYTPDEVSEMYNSKKCRVVLRVPCQTSTAEVAFVTPVGVIGLSADL